MSGKSGTKLGPPENLAKTERIAVAPGLVSTWNLPDF